MGWLIFLLVCLQPLPQLVKDAWRTRHVLLLGIAPTVAPLPQELAQAACPPLKLRDDPLPVDEWVDADRERNRRLYGEDKVLLRPRYIVLHFTVIANAQDVLASFQRPAHLGVGNQEPVLSLVSVHYMVDKDGLILRLVPENRRTSGTYGLDHRALAIEMVASNEADLLSRPQQLLASFCLVDGLLKKYHLPVSAVLSHQEVAWGNLFLSDYTDLADTAYPYFYPKASFRYDPGSTTMAWCREFLLKRRGLWEHHPIAGLDGVRGVPAMQLGQATWIFAQKQLRATTFFNS